MSVGAAIAVIAMVMMIVVMLIFIHLPRRERIGQQSTRRLRPFLVADKTGVESRPPMRLVQVRSDHRQFLPPVADSHIVRIAVPVRGNFSFQLRIARRPFAALLSRPPHARGTMPQRATGLR